MKKCPNCGHSVGDLEENCNRCGEALAVDPAAILAAMSRKKKKKKKRIRSLFWLLVPALLLGGYTALLEYKLLPETITMLGKTYKFVSLFSVSETAIIAFVGFYVLPFIWLIAVFGRMISKARATREEARLINLGARLDDEVLQDGGNVNGGNTEAEAHDAEAENGNAEMAPLPEFSYRKLREIDRAGMSSDRYSDGVTLEGLLKAIQGYVATRGIAVSDGALSSLLSAMAISRILWVNGKDAELTRRALGAVSEFFGSELHIDRVGEDVCSPETLAVRCNEEGDRFESDFLTDVYSAIYAPASVRFAALEGVAPETMGGYLSQYLASAEAWEKSHQATVLGVSDENAAKHIIDGKLELPKNLWYVIIPGERASYFARPENAIPVELSGISEIAEDAEISEVERTPVSREWFSELARKARDVYYIPEEYWKKVDQVEEYVAQRVRGYRLDNKSIRKIEAYAAVYLATGGKLFDALDCIVAAKVLTELQGCSSESLSGEENGLFPFLDRVFGLDNMPLSNESARKLGAV
ncbi:MAG: hypothetical protein IKB34_04715 [Clostridia bacterium]|nr:hypothetical protein [Clostridia bacterium]